VDDIYQNLQNQFHTFVIAEAGSNWKCGSYNEDLERAKEMIKTASRAGVDAIKFQTYKAETVYVPNAGKINYLSKVSSHKSINEVFQYLSMPYEMISELAKFCNQENIFFMSTPFSVEDAQQIDPFVKLHKIASYELNHTRLLEFLSSTKKPILISTGASTYDEINYAINLIKGCGNKSIVLLQCTSKYPAPVNTLNLSVIPKMKSRYKLPVGLSDHSLNPLTAPLLAIGYGATVIEKHFTLDRNLPGPDHLFSLNPEELESMINSIREADLAKGTGHKEIQKEELELRRFATRSLQAIKNIAKGELLEEGKNFDVLRPGNRSRGTEARFLNQVNGKKTKKDVEMGDGITEYE